MRSDATTPDQYLASLPPDRSEVIGRLRRAITARLPRGFDEVMSYGMIGWVVPHRTYPAGYHVNPALPLPFINLASQKAHFAVYHMGLYDGPLLDWFQRRYREVTGKAPDLGRCCLRFKRPAEIPFELLGELAAR
ncbi:MAG: DUF1801 domain-containing protein, partial [Deltaproteobacteria bacterium]|nr:DUF1801 domain-containing protein [Deltaproteobacteria bacterium]